jgi:hypothetical protein
MEGLQRGEQEELERTEEELDGAKEMHVEKLDP